jgi:6-phosphofructokinase 1
MTMRIGLLTGGGDCPGLNAAIRAVVRVATSQGDEVVGFRHGWRGVVDREYRLLGPDETRGILQRGGTILGTARYHPDLHQGGLSAATSAVEELQIDALIVLGGDGTLGAALSLAELGVPVIGIPKTIDNDVSGTKRCIGFDTAVATVAEAIDRVHTTGESHDRLMVVEVMGRTTGWLAISAGLAAGADAMCLPEEPVDLDELAGAIKRRHDRGVTSSVVVVAEGTRFLGHPATGDQSPGMAASSGLAEVTGYETRLTVLGHTQRGGPPIASDRLLATRFGVAAVGAAHRGAFRRLVSGVGDEVGLVPLDEVSAGPRPVTPDILEVARQLTVG